MTTHHIALLLSLLAFGAASLFAQTAPGPAPLAPPTRQRIPQPRSVTVTPNLSTEKVSADEGVSAVDDVAGVAETRMADSRIADARVADARAAAFKMTPPTTDVASTSNSFLLQSSRQAGTTDLVETLLEASGSVRQVDGEMQARDSKVEVVAGFRFEERTVGVPSAATSVAVRQYNLAKAKMKIGDSLKTPDLDPQRRTIVARCDQNRVTLFSPAGSLKGDQFLLIEDLPGFTLAIDRLLPVKQVSVGDSWEIGRGAVQAFLSIDAVASESVIATLTAVADELAMIDIVGEVEGVCLGAATEMSLKAKLQFDLKTKRVNWVGMVIDENRSMSYVGPAMEIAARVQIKISPNVEPQSLTDDRIAEIKTDANASHIGLVYSDGEGAWRFQYARDWYIFQDAPQETILRLMRSGELVAQCTVTDAGQVEPRNVVTLAKLSADLEVGLAKARAKVVAADEYQSEIGYRERRVVLDGTSDDLVLRWIYYLLTDPVGNQVMVVFVVEASMLEAFGYADADIVETVRIGK